jgi:hypothetical protein
MNGSESLGLTMKAHFISKIIGAVVATAKGMPAVWNEPVSFPASINTSAGIEFLRLCSLTGD